MEGHNLTYRDAYSWALTEDCLANLGFETFVKPALGLVQELGADQVMVFSYRADHASCLLSRNFSHENLGNKLAADYLNGEFQKDPLYKMALSIGKGMVDVLHLSDISESLTEDYLKKFYSNPGLNDKTAILVCGETLRLIINLYWRTPRVDPSHAKNILPVLGRLLLLHFERRDTSDVPSSLTVLSGREREVCIGILNGKKAEIIADEIGISSSTVVTYRKRAYDKLNINSRAGLFAICRD